MRWRDTVVQALALNESPSEKEGKFDESPAFCFSQEHPQ